MNFLGGLTIYLVLGFVLFMLNVHKWDKIAMSILFYVENCRYS